MKSHLTYSLGRLQIIRQRGLVLFFALIALLVLSLAAVALIHSVNTNTIIAGNLAFRQSATSSGDQGVDAAMTWLASTQAANMTVNVLSDPTHPFNNDATANGYYSGLSTAVDLFADATWTTSTITPITDSSGNEIRYIIQRLCRTANVAAQNADCLYSAAVTDPNGQEVKLPQDICIGTGCPMQGQIPEMRITTRTKGPNNTVSYLQALVY